MGVIASLTGGAGLFLAFRLAIELVGNPLVGGWALIQGAFFLSRVNDSGTGINITRMVAVSRSEDGHVPLFDVLCVGILLGVVPVLLIGLLLIEPVDWLMVDYFQSPLPRGTIFNLVLLSFGTALLASLAGLLLSILEGAGGLFYRHIVMIASNLSLGVSAYPLLTGFGAEGLGLIYLVAVGIQLAGGIIILPLCVPPSRRSSQSKKVLFASLWRENLKTAGMALVRVTFEPWTKFLVANAAGLGAVASLDLALRITTQVRVAVQSAMQPLLALGARSSGSDADHFHSQYNRAHKLVVLSNICLAGVLSLAGPVVGFFGFGYLPGDFLTFFILLVLANSINSIGIVGYFYSVSGGMVGRVLNIHFVMMAMNLGLGLVGAMFFGAWAVVLAYALSFAYGGIALAQPWMNVSGVRWGQLVWGERSSLLLAGLAVGALGILVVPCGPGEKALYAAVSAPVLAATSTAASIALLAYFAFRNWRLFR